MYNTLEEANAAAEQLNTAFQYLHAATIQVYKFNFEPKYKVEYVPVEYREQYNNATFQVKCLFHYACYLGFGLLINEGVQALYNSDKIKARFDTATTTDAKLEESKTYLGL